MVYIAQAPSNYCADATPTRGVWSQIHSLCHNLSRLYRRSDRSPCNVYTFMKHTHMGSTFHAFSLSLFTDQSFTQPAVHTDMLPLPWTIRALPTLGTVISSQEQASDRRSVLCYHYVLTICGSEERSESRARVRSELQSIR